jgi:hypothetical protein
MRLLVASLLFFSLICFFWSRQIEPFTDGKSSNYTNPGGGPPDEPKEDIDDSLCMDEDTKKIRKTDNFEKRRIAKIKKKRKGNKEVFLIYNKFNYIEAQEVCKKYSGRLATEEELQEALENGANWCIWGWLDEQMIGHPVQDIFWKETEKIHKGFCGPHPGVNKLYNIDPMKKFSVTCYGIKPKKTKKDKPLDDLNRIDPVSKAIKECKLDQQRERNKCKTFEEEQKNLRLLGFNHDKWSDRQPDKTASKKKKWGFF